MAQIPVEDNSAPTDNSENLPQPAERSTADYAQHSRPEKPIRNWTKMLTIFLIVVVLAGVGAGAYLYLKNHKSTPAKTVQTSQPAASAKISATTKHYNSPNLYLGFDYPTDWELVDSGGGIMTVTSPKTQLKTASGEEVNGKIVLTIRNKTQKLPEFTAGNAVAARPSLKISYTKPTQTQRGTTYLSFLRYATSSSSGGLDGVYITGDTGYTLDQAIPAADFVPVDPVVDVSFLDANGKALTIAASSWDNTTFSTPLQKLLESLSIT